MRKPKMILFDYGQTLLNEYDFNGIKGTQAVLECCVSTPNHITAEEVQEFADKLNNDIGRYNPESQDLYCLEIHNHQFQKYLYESLGINTIVSPLKLETTFWNASTPGRFTENIVKLLDYLKDENIRTGVISNISFSGEALTNRINEFLPEHNFEFIIATSEYIFRKPHKRIYELALKKANLEAKDVWYCGDNAVCDIDGAKSAGMTPVWYKGAIGESTAIPKNECITINDWLDLIKLLDKG